MTAAAAFPQRAVSSTRKDRRAARWSRGKARRAARAAAQREREQANRATRAAGGMTPWQQAKAARRERRHGVAPARRTV